MAGLERRDPVQDRRVVLGRARDQRGADRGSVGQLDIVDATFGRTVQVDLSEAGVELDRVAQLLAEPVVQRGGLTADRPADALVPRGAPPGPVAARVRHRRACPRTRRPRGACRALPRCGDRARRPGTPTRLRCTRARAGARPVPWIEKITAAASGSVSPVPSARMRSTRSRCRFGFTETHLRCGSSRLSLTVAFWTCGSSERLRVRPHTSVLPIADLRRHARVVRLDHRAGDLADQEVGVRRIEPGTVGRVLVVEVGPEELPRAGVGVRRPHPHSGERDVGACRDGIGDQVLQHRGPGEQVELHRTRSTTDRRAGA